MDPFNDFMLVILQIYVLLIYYNQVVVIVMLVNGLDNPFIISINLFKFQLDIYSTAVPNHFQECNVSDTHLVLFFHLTKGVEINYNYKWVELTIVAEEIIQFHTYHYGCDTSLLTLGDIMGYRLLTNGQDPYNNKHLKNKDIFTWDIT